MKKKLLILTLCFLWETTLFLSFATAGMKIIQLSWDANNESDLAGYRVYWATKVDNLLTKTSYMMDVGERTSACVEVDDAQKVWFFGVSAYDTSGNESSLTIGYYLFGNIKGDFNEGTTYTDARVDGEDLIYMGLYFGKTVYHDYYDCSTNFSIKIPTLLQKSDLNKDGRIDGKDLSELSVRFGNAAE